MALQSKIYAAKSSMQHFTDDGLRPLDSAIMLRSDKRR